MELKEFVMFIDRSKTYNKLTKVAVERHVDNLRKLDEEGHLERCGVFTGFPGVAGMVILKAKDMDAAKALCEREPLVIEGYATYRLFKFQLANKENNYLY